MHATFLRRARRVAIAAALIIGPLYAAAVGALWLGQERLLFQPQVLAPNEPLPAAADIHERSVDVPGARLSVLELRLPAPRGVVFFLHGNAGSLRSWFVNTDFYRRANVDLVMMDYRGFGRSTGRIESEAQLHADVQAVWDSMAARYRGRPVVVYGRSLGTGLAVRLAARVQPDLTVLVSPYRSMAALAQVHYPWVPTAVLRYPLRSEEAIGAIAGPVLILHGDEDTLIPLDHARALERMARAGRLVVVPGAGHNDLQAHEPYRQALAGALAALP